jgi:hypothetical protein
VSQITLLPDHLPYPFRPQPETSDTEQNEFSADLRTIRAATFVAHSDSNTAQRFTGKSTERPMTVLQGLVSNGGKLYASWKGEPGDDRLFFSSWSGTGAWAPAATIPGATSVGPSMAVFNGAVYAAWKGEWSDPRMFFAKLNGAAWGPQAQIPGNVYSDGGPALATFGGKLVAAWKSVFDQSLHYSSYNGATWSAPAQIPGVASSVGPALAVFGSKLYAAWKGENSDQGIWYASYNGTSWSAQAEIPGVASSVGPSLAAFGNNLYAMWKGESADQGLYYASFNGTKWTAQTRVANVASSTGPALTGFNGKLYAMWKGESGDARLWDAFFDGTAWSAQTNNIPGNTSPDTVTPVAAPGGGLRSNSNYIFSNGNTPLTNVSARIIVTEDIASSNGFGFQLNAYSTDPKGDSCAWQQYSFVVTGNAISGVINNWPVDWYVNGNYVDLILEWFTLESLSSNRLAAGTVLTVTLENDSKGNVTGATFTVVDNTGATKANVTKTLLGFNASGFTSADLAPINGFELNLVGPDGGASTTLTSGQGIFHFGATNHLTCLNAEPSGDLGVGTAETANSAYTPLPASFPNGDFWQLFGTSTTPIAPVAKAGVRRMLRRPTVMA